MSLSILGQNGHSNFEAPQMEPCPLLKRSYAHSVRSENTHRQIARADAHPMVGAEDHGAVLLFYSRPLLVAGKEGGHAENF